ncbi:hypothetical protein KCU81_g654, partial [Aureobasidium melanogenum]
MLSGSSNPVPLKSRYLILENTAARFGNHDNSRPSFVMTRLSSYVSPQPGALCHNMMAVLFGSIRLREAELQSSATTTPQQHLMTTEDNPYLVN